MFVDGSRLIWEGKGLPPARVAEVKVPLFEQEVVPESPHALVAGLRSNAVDVHVGVIAV